mmetsp:Transcript_64480/g.115058  ORF Transcript_64480/g.115058 Transcript_64480/m.115058 type:complete len:174 (+) Transcript_64480:3-524(+)
MELAVIDLIRHVCQQLPVDPTKIYLAGASAGGYAAFRLAELIPRLFSTCISFAGYYPKLPGQDHDPDEAVERMRGISVWAYHCEADKMCRPDTVHVQEFYQALERRLGIEVIWVHPSVSNTKNCHAPHNIIFQDPDLFFTRLLDVQRTSVEAPVHYLQQRLSELQAERGLVIL